MTKNVLFVCTGNTCRSPIAEQLFKKMIRDHKLDEQVQVRSAEISPGIALSNNAESIILEHVERMTSWDQEGSNKRRERNSITSL